MKKLILLFGVLILFSFAVMASSFPSGEDQITVECSSSSIIGDANGDGEITLNDVVYIKGILSEKISLLGDSCCIDINRDSEVTLEDAELVRSHYLGMNQEDSFIGRTCGEMSTCTTSDCMEEEQPVVVCSSDSIVGDANGDGEISLGDVVVIRGIFLKEIASPDNICCVDADGDLEITFEDADLVRDHYLGKDDETSKSRVGNICAQEEPEETEEIIVTCSPDSIIGDASGNEEISLSDSLLVRGIFLGDVQVSRDICCVDVNRDSEVTLEDAELIRDFYLGRDEASTSLVGEKCDGTPNADTSNEDDEMSDSSSNGEWSEGETFTGSKEQNTNTNDNSEEDSEENTPTFIDNLLSWLRGIFGM